jgi:hypothetical protein
MQEEHSRRNLQMQHASTMIDIFINQSHLFLFHLVPDLLWNTLPFENLTHLQTHSHNFAKLYVRTFNLVKYTLVFQKPTCIEQVFLFLIVFLCTSNPLFLVTQSPATGLYHRRL